MIFIVSRKASANRIPIFGESSGDYFRFESNFQIINDRVESDAIVLAFIESELLFGMGMARVFTTTKRALITRATGHIVHELDDRPLFLATKAVPSLPVR